MFCPEAHFFGYRRGGGVRGALSDWVIATDMLSEHESTFCIGCLTTNEDWTFSLSDELEIPHFQAKAKPMMQTDHGSDLKQLTT